MHVKMGITTKLVQFIREEAERIDGECKASKFL